MEGLGGVWEGIREGKVGMGFGSVFGTLTTEGKGGGGEGDRVEQVFSRCCLNEKT